VVGNDWIDKKTGKRLYSTEDARFKYLDEETPEHSGTSPFNIKVTTVGDELIYANSKSKVIAIAGKDRSAIGLAGQHGTAYMHSKHIVVKLLALIALACSLATTARAESFAKRVDIGKGRMMYIECHGNGSPTVLLISGTDTASDLWHAADQKGPTVYDDIQKTTRVCAYDRPGAPHLDQTFSRSDPVRQPTSPQNGVDDLVALLKAADVPGPYVLVAHSFGGTIARVFAGEHPDEVKGIVFVDVLTPELRAQMTPEEWKVWKRINARPAKALAAYPDLERQDFDETLDQTAAAAALRPMPVVVLTASDKFIDVVPKLIQAGELPPDTPPDFGAVVDRANSAAQNELAALVPGAVHITDTHSGHNIMIDNAPVVIQAIRMMVDAVRAGQTSLKG
jgi:pimeloyl-ACP methyl ester carboxylesterase